MDIRPHTSATSSNKGTGHQDDAKEGGKREGQYSSADLAPTYEKEGRLEEPTNK
jgi:hypothetical protein